MENFIESLYVPYQNKAAKAVIKDKIMIAVPMGTVSVPGLVTFNAEDFSVIGGKVFISSKRFDDKLDKVVSAATTGRVYAVGPSGENYMQPFSTTPGANCIPLRDSNGDVLVPTTPSSNNAAISMTYADGRYIMKKPHTTGKTEVYTQTDDGIGTKEVGDTAGDIPVRNANGNITGHSPLTDDEYTTKSFVNSSIANEAADYISNNGEPFTSLEELQEYTKTHTVTNNDYAIVIVTDGNGTRYDRYKYNESTGVWGFEYSINNSSFTEAQWAAINSGLTSAKLATMLTEIDNLMAQSLMSVDEVVAPYGESTVTYDTTDGITLHGALAVKTNDGNYWNIPLTFSLPVVAGDGLVADSAPDNKKMTIKIDSEKVMKMPSLDQQNLGLAVAVGKWTSGTSSTKVPDAIQWRDFQKGVAENAMVQRTENGNVLLPDDFPTSPEDDGKDAYGNVINTMATPKSYVDANDWHIVDINENASFTQEQYNIIETYWPKVMLRATPEAETQSYEYFPYFSDESASDTKSFYFTMAAYDVIKQAAVSMFNGEIRYDWKSIPITTSSTDADSIVKRTSTGNINVPSVPEGKNSATSKTYVDKAIANAGSKQVVVPVTTSETMNTSWTSNPVSITVSGTLDADAVTNLQKEGAIVDFSFSNITHLLLPRQYALEKSTSYLFFGGAVPLTSGTAGYPYSFYFRVSLSDNKYSLNYVPIARQTDVTAWISSATANMQKTTNLSTSIGDSPSDTKYPSEKAVADYITDNAGIKFTTVYNKRDPRSGYYYMSEEDYSVLEESWPYVLLDSGTAEAPDGFPVFAQNRRSAPFGTYTYVFLSCGEGVAGFNLYYYNVTTKKTANKGYRVEYSTYTLGSSNTAVENTYAQRDNLGNILLPDQKSDTLGSRYAISRAYFDENPFMKLIDFSALKDTENSQNLTMTITSDVFVDIINNLKNRYVKTGMIHDHERIFSPDNNNEFCLFWPNCLTYDENDSSQTTDVVAHFVGGHNGKFYEVQVSGSSATTGVWTNTKATLVELDAYLDKPENTGTVGQVLAKTETGSQWVDSVTVQVVNIDSPAEATNGTLTAAQLAILQASDQNYIMFNHEKYYLGDKGHQEGFLTYSHVGYENGSHFLKSITITISTLAWALTTTECASKSYVETYVNSLNANEVKY